MKVSLENCNSRFEQKKERIGEIEERSISIIQTENPRQKRLKENEQSLRNLWDTIK